VLMRGRSNSKDRFQMLADVGVRHIREVLRDLASDLGFHMIGHRRP